MFERHRHLVLLFLITCALLTALVTVVLVALFAPRKTEATPTSSAVARGVAATETAPATRTAAPTLPPPSPTPIPSPPPTPTLRPTSPPAPALPSPPAQGSKLGVHGIWPDGILTFTQTLAQAGRPFRVVKAVDDLSWLQAVKRISPETVTVARLTHGDEGAGLVNDPNTDLDAYAAVLMAPILDAVEQDPDLRSSVDYWELTNEPLGGGLPPEAYARLARLTIKGMEIAEANGLKLAIFSFNAGTPEWADMVAIVETGVFARAKAGGHILALHEGVFGDDPVDKWWNVHFVDAEGHPTTQDTGMTAPGGWIPGGPVLEGAGALCLRFRFLYHLLAERDQVVPLFVSEFYAGGGYDPAHKADVVNRMAWYDAQLGAYDYALGFAPFTLGPTSGWTHQDYAPFYEGPDGLVAYMMGR